MINHLHKPLGKTHTIEHFVDKILGYSIKGLRDINFKSHITWITHVKRIYSFRSDHNTGVNISTWDKAVLRGQKDIPMKLPSLLAIIFVKALYKKLPMTMG